MCSLIKIENKRSELLNAAKNSGLTSPTTLQYSKELDELLINHQRNILKEYIKDRNNKPS